MPRSFALATLALALLGACHDEAPAPPTPTPSIASKEGAEMREEPGSRVSLWLPKRAERFGRGHIYEFSRAGVVQVRVAEANLDATSPADIDAQLRRAAGVDPSTALVEDPPGSGRWHTPPGPGQALIRELRAKGAAATILVGFTSEMDRGIAEQILDRAELDETATYDPQALMRVTLDPPPQMVRLSDAGPVITFGGGEGKAGGGLTIGWVPATVPLDDAFLSTTLRDWYRTQVGGEDLRDHPLLLRSGLKGRVLQGSTPAAGGFYLAVLTVPGEDEGMFMVFASAEGEAAQERLRGLVTSAESLRAEPIPDRAGASPS